LAQRQQGALVAIAQSQTPAVFLLALVEQRLGNIK
jgi:hypothetical protein